MMNKPSIFTLVLALMVLAACNQGKFPGFEQSNTGLYYQIHNRSQDTTSAREGDLMVAHFQYVTDGDSVFSQNTDKAYRLNLQKSVYPGDIWEGLALLHPGDSATFVVESDSFFTKIYPMGRPDFLDSGSYFFIRVKVDSIISAQQQQEMMLKDMEKRKASEQTVISTFLSNNKGYKALADTIPVYIRFDKKGKGRALKTGDYIKAHITISHPGTGEQLFNSKQQAPDGTDILTGTGYWGQGFDEAVKGRKAGDHFSLLVHSDYAFGARGAEGFVGPYTPLLYDIDILNTYTQQEFDKKKLEENKQQQTRELKQIQDYIKRNHLKPTKLQEGLYKQIKQEGSGTQAVTGKKVSVHYTGYLLDGTKFDSSVDKGKPFEFVLGQGQVIPGWDFGVSTMKVGEKALFIISSNLAYGAQGAGGVIPPHAVLVFDVELLDVK